MLRPYPIPRLLLYCSPPHCCPALIILHHPPPFVVLADCYIQIEKPSARVRRHPARASVPPGRAPTPCLGAHLRPRFGSCRVARGAVLPGRLAPSRSSSRRRTCVVVLPGRASPSPIRQLPGRGRWRITRAHTAIPARRRGHEPSCPVAPGDLR